jgi:hypothetical protein
VSDHFMKVKLNCPHCDGVLIVPGEASGRRAECSHCSGRFVVPDFGDKVDSMATNWLEMDAIDDGLEDDIPELPPDGGGPLLADRNTAPGGWGGRVPIESDKADDHIDLDEQLSQSVAPQGLGGSDSGSEASVEDLDQLLGEAIGAQPSKSQPVRESSGDSTIVLNVDQIALEGSAADLTELPETVQSTPPAAAPPKTESTSASVDSIELFQRSPEPDLPALDLTNGSQVEPPEPIEISTKPAPAQPTSVSPPMASPVPAGAVHLTLERMDLTGIHFQFCSTMLHQPGFRASFPLRCLSCQKDDVKNLTARPLWWLDRSNEHITDTLDAQAAYELRLERMRTIKSSREVLKEMRSIEELESPFSDPMPFYVCERCAQSVKVNATIEPAKDGIRCGVLIPSGTCGPYALEWLGRVNGVCGEEYERLERKVLLTHETWRTIPSKVRRHMTGWFDFEPEEEFLLYLSDVEFLSKDAGLAGLVLTDRRLVWHKYRHLSQIRLDQEGQLRAVPDGHFMELFHVRNGDEQKTVKLKAEDVPTISMLLRDVDAKLELVQVEA